MMNMRSYSVKKADAIHKDRTLQCSCIFEQENIIHAIGLEAVGLIIIIALQVGGNGVGANGSYYARNLECMVGHR